MPKNLRLTRTDFKNMRGFKRLQGRFFSLSFGTIHGRTSPGGACVVSAKAVARANARNRIRRRCREILRAALKDTRSAHVFVIIAKKGAADAVFEDTKADLHSLFARAQGVE